jgi:mannitol/fructose-specific phosphotransferase system IIA component (Ntr-type)
MILFLFCILILYCQKSESENIKQIQRITKDNEKVRKEIENAETEEEILQIVNTIVSANNGRVRK